MFGNINFDEVESVEEVNRVGGSSRIEDTGAYTVVFEKVYIDTADSGALNFVWEGKDESGAILRHNDYIVSGAAKGNKPIVSTYPKYNSLAKLLAGVDLFKITPVEAEVMVYDFDLKKEVSKKKQIIKEFIGKPIEVLMTKEREFKQAKNAAGVYENTEETRDKLGLNTFLDPVSHKTASEKFGGEPAEFKTKWLEKNPSDYVWDKTKGKGKAPSTGGAQDSTAPKTEKKFGINQG